MQSALTSDDGDVTGVLVRHRVQGFSERWVVPEGPVPESAWHDQTVSLLRAVLDHWVVRSGRNAAVYRNVAVKVRGDQPSVGFDPDLCVVEPAPPGASEISSLRLWEPGHTVPLLVIEVVNPGHPHKDYTEVPDQCAALGVSELVVFDPLLVGPKVLGDARRIQVWQRTRTGTFDRVGAGEGPLASAVLGAWLVTAESGRRLRVAHDSEGRRPWLTAEEAERSAKDAAIAHIAELEAKLAQKG